MEGHSAQAAHETPPPVARPSAAPYYKRGISGFMLFMFSVPSGANYMYMGLIKRGLAAMCGFFLLIYLMTTALPTLPIVFTFVTYVIACFFDGFNIRRKINAGIPVEDGVGDVLNGILNNKTLMVVILVFIALAFAGSIIGFAVELIRRAVPLLLVLLALYIIFKRNPKA